MKNPQIKIPNLWIKFWANSKSRKIVEIKFQGNPNFPIDLRNSKININKKEKTIGPTKKDIFSILDFLRKTLDIKEKLKLKKKKYKEKYIIKTNNASGAKISKPSKFNGAK